MYFRGSNVLGLQWFSIASRQYCIPSWCGVLVYKDLTSSVARIVFFEISLSPCITFKEFFVSFMYEGEVSTIALR